MNRIVTAGLLKHTGIRTDLASGGAEALSLAEQNTYDLILMDQRMPEMDGTEALHRLRQLKNNPNRDIPVLCLTADAILGAKESLSRAKIFSGGRYFSSAASSCAPVTGLVR